MNQRTQLENCNIQLTLLATALLYSPILLSASKPETLESLAIKRALALKRINNDGRPQGPKRDHFYAQLFIEIMTENFKNALQQIRKNSLSKISQKELSSLITLLEKADNKTSSDFLFLRVQLLLYLNPSMTNNPMHK